MRCCERWWSQGAALGRTWLVGVLAVGWALAAAGAPGAAAGRGPTCAAQPFDTETWGQWRQQLHETGRPRLVVFSATWCAVCPGVIQALAEDAGRRRSGVSLEVVLTDLDPGDPGVGAHAHGADACHAFDGIAAAIRHRVDPRWRGVVPRVVWLMPERAPEAVEGLPGEALRQRWWRQAQAARGSAPAPRQAGATPAGS